MKTTNSITKKVFWLEDQYEDLMDYSSPLARINYLVDPVRSASDALEKLQKEEYDLYIFDLKVLPGDSPEWEELDNRKREENPDFDPYLGLELLRYLDRARQDKSELWEKIKFDFGKVIVFSVVSDKDICDELESFGIPGRQIVIKSGSTLDTLANVIVEIQDEKYEQS
jgi:hypothetical protein